MDPQEPAPPPGPQDPLLNQLALPVPFLALIQGLIPDDMVQDLWVCLADFL